MGLAAIGAVTHGVHSRAELSCSLSAGTVAIDCASQATGAAPHLPDVSDGDAFTACPSL